MVRTVTAQLLRERIDAGDVDGVRALVVEDPTLLTAALMGPADGWADTPPLDYVSLSGFHGFSNHHRMGEIAQVLLDAGARLDGDALLNAASYDEPRVAKVLVERGADLEVMGGAVPEGGTPLAHAVHFGCTEVALVLADSGAQVRRSFDAAGIGDVERMLALLNDADAPRSLRAAAVNGQLRAIDALLDAGVPIDVLEGDATALHWAAWAARLDTVRHLVARGADPRATDPVHGGTPAGWARHRRSEVGPAFGHDEVAQLLDSLT